MDRKSACHILGVLPSAGAREIKKAFRDKAKSSHPDRFASSPDQEKQAQEKMQQINAAFDFLMALVPLKETRCDPDPRAERARKTEPRERCQNPKTGKKGPPIWERFFGSFKPNETIKSSRVKANGSGKRKRVPGRKRARGVGQNQTRGFEAYLNERGGGSRSPMPGQTGQRTTGAGRGQPARPDSYAAYSRYVHLKRQIKRRQQGQAMGISRVEKIAPVQRILPVK